MVMNRQHLLGCRGERASDSIAQGAARVTVGKFVLAGVFLTATSAAELRASPNVSPLAATSFAYSVSHPVSALPSWVIARTINTDGRDSDAADAFDEPHDTRVDVRIGAPRVLSRSSMCSAIVSVARANDLPIPFFANLIWQESSFNVRTISSAGALGVAQFMPKTAVEFGLINPFEPIHALHVAGKFLRKLNGQFGNLGLAAAAYNGGSGRVSNWMAKRGELPGETRNYVSRITGRGVEQWTSNEFARSPEATLMPAKAPCVEVAEEVAAQTKIVRVANLISELAAATAPPPPRVASNDEKNNEKFDEAAWMIAIAKPSWRAQALTIVRATLKTIGEQKVREASAKAISERASQLAAKAAIKTARDWDRIADLTMRKAAAEFARAPADDKPSKPSRRTRVAYSR